MGAVIERMEDVLPWSQISGRRSLSEMLTGGPCASQVMRLTFVLLVATLATSATAETYRCGNTYQDHPCPGGALVDTTATSGAELRGPTGKVVHSRQGDQARIERSKERIHEITHNGLGCAVAGQQAVRVGETIDCPAMKAERDAKRQTPDYIKR